VSTLGKKYSRKARAYLERGVRSDVFGRGGTGTNGKGTARGKEFFTRFLGGSVSMGDGGGTTLGGVRVDLVGGGSRLLRYRKYASPVVQIERPRENI